MIDRNIWIAALINPSGLPGLILAAFRERRFQLITCNLLIDEFARVARRPRLLNRYRYQQADIDSLSVLMRGGSLFSISGMQRYVRDPKDGMVIETALVGQADVVVTGDKDIRDDD